MCVFKDCSLSRAETLTAAASTETHKRTKLIDEILEKIIDIKIHCLEQPLARRVKGVRSREIELVSRSLRFSSTIYLLDIALKAAIIVIVFGYIDSSESALTSYSTESLLVVMLYYLFIFHTMMRTWPNSIRRYREASACIGDVEAIFSAVSNPSSLCDDSSNSALLGSTVVAEDSSIQLDVKSCRTTDKPSILIKSLRSKSIEVEDELETTDDPFELHCEHLKLTKGKKYLLLGGLDIERRHFIQILLKERHVDDGEMEIVGRRCFASQNPCVIRGSIRQNVLLSETYEKTKYKNIIEMCDLTRDEEALNGCEIDDISTSDECCATLKQRINLARWMYADAEIYIVEMPHHEDDNEMCNIIIRNAIKRQQFAKVGIL